MKRIILFGLAAAALAVGSGRKEDYPEEDASRRQKSPVMEIVPPPNSQNFPAPLPDVKISYFNFSEINSLNIPAKQVNLPSHLEHLALKLAERASSLSHPERFHQEILQLAAERGYTNEGLSRLKPGELARLSAYLIGDRMEYLDVDWDADFISRHGQFLPVDNYFYLGKGDCDKYAHLVIAAFDFLKGINSHPEIKNVYLTAGMGGNWLPHAWVSVIVAESESKIRISHIDPTSHDGGGRLDVHFGQVNPRYSRSGSDLTVDEYVQQLNESRLVDGMFYPPN